VLKIRCLKDIGFFKCLGLIEYHLLNVAFSQEKIMQVISARAAQQKLETICEQVYQNHEPYIVNRENHHNVVILSRRKLL